MKIFLCRLKSFFSLKITLRAVIAFILALTVCFSFVFIIALNRSRVEKLTMERLIAEKSLVINDVIMNLLQKTYILSTFIVHNNGSAEGFDIIAPAIVDDGAILNVTLAPSGIATYIYPLEGNESLLGFNYFTEGTGNKEAILAKETDQLVMGGPFDSVQGEKVIVGRLPVYIKNDIGKDEFWGLVAIALRFPKALDYVGLDDLTDQGFAYEIWRINPDDDEKQIIFSPEGDYYKNGNYVEKELVIANAVWYFRILTVNEWYNFPEIWAAIAVSILLSLFIAVITFKNRKLKIIRDKLEVASNEDPLTGIYNRRYFMGVASRETDKSRRTGVESYIIIFDLDHFKRINDKYGHLAGDKVLIETASAVSEIVRSYDLLARYGGEEFIIFVDNIDKESVMALGERMRSDIASNPVDTGVESVRITASFGIAPAGPYNSLEQSIALADTALYKAKDEGRDLVIFNDGKSFSYPKRGIPKRIGL